MKFNSACGFAGPTSTRAAITKRVRFNVPSQNDVTANGALDASTSQHAHKVQQQSKLTRTRPRCRSSTHRAAQLKEPASHAPDEEEQRSGANAHAHQLSTSGGDTQLPAVHAKSARNPANTSQGKGPAISAPDTVVLCSGWTSQHLKGASTAHVSGIAGRTRSACIKDGQAHRKEATALAPGKADKYAGTQNDRDISLTHKQGLTAASPAANIISPLSDRKGSTTTAPDKAGQCCFVEEPQTSTGAQNLPQPARRSTAAVVNRRSDRLVSVAVAACTVPVGIGVQDTGATTCTVQQAPFAGQTRAACQAASTSRTCKRKAPAAPDAADNEVQPAAKRHRTVTTVKAMRKPKATKSVRHKAVAA